MNCIYILWIFLIVCLITFYDFFVCSFVYLICRFPNRGYTATDKCLREALGILREVGLRECPELASEI